jgi:hypothetical protein
MLLEAGVTVIAVSGFPLGALLLVTVNDALPDIPPRAAAIAVVPAEAPVATPAFEMAATAGEELDHATEPVTFWVELSEYVATAAYCCVPCRPTVALIGETVILVIPVVDAFTVSTAVPVTPLSCAVILLVPALNAYAVPALVTLPAAAFEDCQVTALEMSAMVPSE